MTSPTRTRWFPWLIAAGTMLVLVGLVAVLGGFAPAAPDRRGAATDAGQPVDTRNWRITVHRAVLTDTRPTGGTLDDPVLRLEVEVTNLDDRTQPYPRRGVVTVDAGGELTDEAQWSTPDGRAVDLDPKVPRRLLIDFPANDAAEVDVVLSTETESWSVADGVATEALGDPVARVRLSVADERGAR